MTEALERVARAVVEAHHSGLSAEITMRWGAREEDARIEMSCQVARPDGTVARERYVVEGETAGVIMLAISRNVIDNGRLVEKSATVTG